MNVWLISVNQNNSVFNDIQSLKHTILQNIYSKRNLKQTVINQMITNQTKNELIWSLSYTDI